ncbi:MAG TPA: TonB-dependent receptor, partial [Thermoanaerobaculia bacterium]|nr:TonB-dependent receptor [Thermoanaerobaculia bacterium]
MKKSLPLLLLGALAVLPLSAQQTGSIQGTVTGPDGGVLPGVTVEASGDVLPRPRVTNTLDNGTFALPQLPPGNYTITFTLSGLETVTRSARVLLDQSATLDVTLAPEALKEEISVVAEASLLDRSSAEVKSAVDDDVIDKLPVGQEYQDLLKLIPGVQISQDEVRGPSAGGSGQDNVYLFDGVNVTLPLFGTLGSEPSSHDISQVSVIKGGARAVDFNRSGGFQIDSVSESGTNDYHLEASYQVQSASMTDDLKNGSSAQFERDRDWSLFNIGGPVWREHLLFYASYYRPTVSADNRSNFYGDVPDYDNVREELFGKLTWTPAPSVLVHGSYRDSDHEINADTAGTAGAILETHAGSTSSGSDATLAIKILEGSWVVNQRSFASFKYTDFANEGATRPDTLFDFPIRVDGSVRLDVANLDHQGRFDVPLSSTDPLVAAIIPGLINRYGYLQNGVRKGGGRVGGASQIDQNDFFRENAQVAYDYMLGKNVTHELHAGYQWYRDEEDLARLSNGWGTISVPATPTTFNGQPVFYIARFQQQSLQGAGGNLVPTIHSEFESQNFELNDTIRWADWTFNVGVMVSNDEYFGQGLREVSGNVSGFALAPGNKYKMYETDWSDMLSP